MKAHENEQLNITLVSVELIFALKCFGLAVEVENQFHGTPVSVELIFNLKCSGL